MNVYRRYFRIKTGKLIQAFKDAEKTNELAKNLYKEILKEIGANPAYYHVDHKLHSFVFEEQPDTKIYKRKDNGWYPKKNNKTGKEIANKIESVETVSPRKLLNTVGLSDNPAIFSMSKAYMPSLTVVPEKEPVAYVSIPWYDADPEKMAQYKIDNAKGIHSDQNMEFLQWEPTEEMEEVKNWEVEKHIDEWNSSIKK